MWAQQVKIGTLSENSYFDGFGQNLPQIVPCQNFIMKLAQ